MASFARSVQWSARSSCSHHILLWAGTRYALSDAIPVSEAYRPLGPQIYQLCVAALALMITVILYAPAQVPHYDRNIDTLTGHAAPSQGGERLI